MIEIQNVLTLVSLQVRKLREILKYEMIYENLVLYSIFYFCDDNDGMCNIFDITLCIK